MRTPKLGLRTRPASATVIALVIMALGVLVPLTAGVGHAHDWNDGSIQWQTYEKGLALAAKEKKPICLIFFTEWCPHCKTYSRVFHDPRVVEKAKDFVLIHVNNDKAGELATKFSPDGPYVPRTFFLSSAGVLDPELHAPRDKFKYFYDETDPAGLLAGMDAAKKKFQ